MRRTAPRDHAARRALVGIATRRVLGSDLTGFVDDGEDEPHWSVAAVGGLGAADAAVAGNLWINRWGGRSRTGSGNPWRLGWAGTA